MGVRVSRRSCLVGLNGSVGILKFNCALLFCAPGAICQLRLRRLVQRIHDRSCNLFDVDFRGRNLGGDGSYRVKDEKFVSSRVTRSRLALRI